MCQQREEHRVITSVSLWQAHTHRAGLCRAATANHPH